MDLPEQPFVFWRPLYILILSSVAILGFTSVVAFGGQDNVTKEAQPELDFPGYPIDVTGDTIDSFIDKYQAVVVDCWNTECYHCYMIEPKIKQMANDFKGRVLFCKLCVDKNPSTKNRFGITRYPTLLIFKNGTLIDRVIGNYPLPELQYQILQKLGISSG